MNNRIRSFIFILSGFVLYSALVIWYRASGLTPHIKFYCIACSFPVHPFTVTSFPFNSFISIVFVDLHKQVDCDRVSVKVILIGWTVWHIIIQTKNSFKRFSGYGINFTFNWTTFNLTFWNFTITNFDGAGVAEWKFVSSQNMNLIFKKLPNKPMKIVSLTKDRFSGSSQELRRNWVKVDK